MHWTVVALAMVVQSEHDPAVEVNEYEPAVQGLHVVAPGFVPVFVKESGPHV